MVLKLGSKKTEQSQAMLTAHEAFSLWDVLCFKYDGLELLGIFERFAHDPDLKLIVKSQTAVLIKHKEHLEKLMKKYAVQPPDQGRLPTNWAGNSEPLRDEFIARNLLTDLGGHMENLIKCIKNCYFNDEIRVAFVDMALKVIEETDPLVKYLKLKGWVAAPPEYPNTPADTGETIDLAAAAHLWEHLVFRYDNLWQTQLFGKIANDGDLKILLERGVSLLDKQIKVLERECQKFGMTLPKKPAKFVVTLPSTAETIGDDKLYRIILGGHQGALVMHAEAVKQCITNDRIRVLFVKLLTEELSAYNRFAKYGKLKGWLNPEPMYAAYVM